MVVASGQMPYEFDAPLPIRALPNAWPRTDTPNIAVSGDTMEQAMFVLNAELRKWNYFDLDDLTYQAYWHPDIASSGFEPKGDGETLTGLVGPTATVLAVNNVEQMRRNLQIKLFDQYADDSVYDRSDFLRAWLETAYPESPSGHLHVIQIAPPANIFAFVGRTFLRPAAEHITGGDYVDNDIHWLGGSGVYFDIDCGEVAFNPFPFLGQNRFNNPANGSHRFNFAPITPAIQTTAGSLPSVEASRYESDIGVGNFRADTNFQALGSGKVQIDGYALVDGTTIELVRGDDRNIDGITYTSEYTNHVQGLRQVAAGNGSNDPSARCYRTPTAHPSGMYRLLVHSQKGDVPFTAIPSGFVSLWPQGLVAFTDTGLLAPQSNFTDGQQLTSASDGTTIMDASAARGVHVLDDAIWITSPNDNGGSGTYHSAGLFVVSPYNGDLVWYRPAERVVATSGNQGNGPGIFGAHVGLFKLGTDFVRLSTSASQFVTSEASPIPDTGVFTIHWQRYNQTTLDYTEQSTNWTIIQDNQSDTVNAIHGAFSDGANVYSWRELGTVHRFTTGLAFDGYFEGPIARRRHYAGGNLLYTIAGSVQAGDPIINIGSSSGIGKWSIATEPATITTDNGTYTHDSAKPLRAETHFGHQTSAVIHHIFDVTGSTHAKDGVWMLIQFVRNLYLCRIVEGASSWDIIESMKFRDLFDSTVGVGNPNEFPIEGIFHDID
jgi:hypothetical protein